VSGETLARKKVKTSFTFFRPPTPRLTLTPVFSFLHALSELKILGVRLLTLTLPLWFFSLLPAVFFVGVFFSHHTDGAETWPFSLCRSRCLCSRVLCVNWRLPFPIVLGAMLFHVWVVQKELFHRMRSAWFEYPTQCTIQENMIICNPSLPSCPESDQRLFLKIALFLLSRRLGLVWMKTCTALCHRIQYPSFPSCPESAQHLFEICVASPLTLSGVGVHENFHGTCQRIQCVMSRSQWALWCFVLNLFSAWVGQFHHFFMTLLIIFLIGCRRCQGTREDVYGVLFKLESLRCSTLCLWRLPFLFDRFVCCRCECPTENLHVTCQQISCVISQSQWILRSFLLWCSLLWVSALIFLCMTLPYAFSHCLQSHVIYERVRSWQIVVSGWVCPRQHFTFFYLTFLFLRALCSCCDSISKLLEDFCQKYFSRLQSESIKAALLTVISIFGRSRWNQFSNQLNFVIHLRF